jgi:hypothetical protein
MVMVFLLCAAYALYCLVTNPAGPITTPDSVHYLNMTPIVPLGYPFFLTFTGARGAIIAQPIIFSVALAFMGREIVRTTRNTWLAVAAVAGCMIVPQLREYHASILSESLFLSLLVVFLGLSIRFAHYPTWRLMVLVAITVGTSAVVRRTGFAFVPVMLVMVLLQRHHLRPDSFPFRGHAVLFFIAAVAPFGAIVGGEQVIAPLIHAGAPSSLMGRHVFAKAALLEASAFAEASASAEATADKTADKPVTPDDAVRRALEDHLETAFAPIRSMLASAPYNVRGVLTIYYETCLQGGCADEARALTMATDEARQTELMGAAGLARIRRAPINFLKLTWLHYGSLWTVNRLRHPDTAPALNQFIAEHRPMPFEHYALSLGPDGTMVFEASPNVRYAQWAMFVVAALTGALAAAGLVCAVLGLRLPPPFIVSSVAALAAHGGLLLTALLAAGFTRFLLGLWPAIVVSLAFGAHGLKSKLRIKN